MTFAFRELDFDWNLLHVSTKKVVGGPLDSLLKVTF
jgi:hypothetical protein